MGPALWTCCSAILLAGCGDKRSLIAIKTPPDRLVCEGVSARPSIPPEYVIDWNAVSKASTVPLAVTAAKAEQAKFVASVRTREGVVAAYIVTIEGRLFACSDNAQWRRDFEAGLPDQVVKP